MTFGAESRAEFAGQQGDSGGTIRMTGWEQSSRGGVFYAGGTGVEYGNGPAKLVDVSFSSIGDGGLRIETQRPLTVPRRV